MAKEFTPQVLVGTLMILAIPAFLLAKLRGDPSVAGVGGMALFYLLAGPTLLYFAARAFFLRSRSA